MALAWVYLLVMRTVTKVGTDSYAAERDRHDDMVLALALACWYREWVSTRCERASAQYRQRAARIAEGEKRANRLAIRNARLRPPTPGPTHPRSQSPRVP